MGEAKRGQRCKWCLSLTHGSAECTWAEGETEITGRLRTIESVVGVSQQASGGRAAPPGYQWTDVCKLFNEGRCSYRICKFRHACVICREDHPTVTSPECASRARLWSAPSPGPMQYSHTFRGRGQGHPY